MNLEDIIKRLKEIVAELENGDLTQEQVDALEVEANNLEQERSKLITIAEKRNKLLAHVRNGAGVTLEEGKEERKVDVDMSKEYRSAFFKRLLGQQLTEEETRAFALYTGTSGAGAVVPEETQGEIMKKLRERAPLLQEITLLQVKGAVKFAVEGVKNPAQKHEELATITADEDTLITISLNQFEVTKKVVVSKTIMTMSVNGFEGWLTDMIAEMIADKLTVLVINGSGTGEATGILTRTWNTSDSVEFTGSLTVPKVLEFLSLLNGGYAKDGKLLMSRKTLFTYFLPLEDNSKNKLVMFDGGKAYLYGYEVMEDDSVDIGTAIFGNFKKYVANLSEQVEVNGGLDLDTGSYKFLGMALFDGKVAIKEAFVKLTKN